MPKKDHATCRYCGSRVSYWGEVCQGCDPAGEHLARVERGEVDITWLVARGVADSSQVGEVS